MEPSATPPKKSKLTLYIIICLVLGIVAGFTLNKNYLQEENKTLDGLAISIQSFNEELDKTTDSLAIQKLLEEKN